jgi:hypothetical protein
VQTLRTRAQNSPRGNGWNPDDVRDDLGNSQRDYEAQVPSLETRLLQVGQQEVPVANRRTFEGRQRQFRQKRIAQKQNENNGKDRHTFHPHPDICRLSRFGFSSRLFRLGFSNHS